MTSPQQTDRVIEAAKRIGRSQEDTNARLLRRIALQTTLIIVAILVLGALLLYEIRNLLEQQQDQIADARVAAAVSAEQQEQILEDIEGRLVPKADVVALRHETRILSKDIDLLIDVTRDLKREVNQLTRRLAASGGG